MPGTTPAAALAAIEGLREAVEAALASDDPDAIHAALARLKRHADRLDFDEVEDADDATAWQPVAEAIEALQAWLDEPVEDDTAPAKRAMTRDEKLKIAIAVASRGRRARRRDAVDVVLDGFYGGLGAVLKGMYHALRLTVIGLAAVSRAAVGGVIHVAEHYRNGRLVHAHDRAAPSKSAHDLYR